MKNSLLNREWFRTGVIVLIAVLLTALAILAIGDRYFTLKTNPTVEVSRFYRPVGASAVSLANRFACHYEQFTFSQYKDGVIQNTLPLPENKGIEIIYSDFVGNDTLSIFFENEYGVLDKTTGVKIADDSETLVFMEGNKVYTTIHTIYKNYGIATYSKSSNIFGMPYVTSGIGYCTGR